MNINYRTIDWIRGKAIPRDCSVKEIEHFEVKVRHIREAGKMGKIGESREKLRENA